MKVLILGIDGYLGWSLALKMLSLGHKVYGCDSGLRRACVTEMGSQSVTPIKDIYTRCEVATDVYNGEINYQPGCLVDEGFTKELICRSKPDVIFHLAEIPSAPYSMIDAEHCTKTHMNNIIGTLNVLYAMKQFCPTAHLIKLGSMGEYGTPNTDIPEDDFELEFRGRKTLAMFPRDPGSFYHATKVHDTVNIRLACRLWGLRSTDIMQGVVYGVTTPEMKDREGLITRFDIDEAFGTAINRFCACAVAGEPLTVYGQGNHKRGFLPLQDSIQCMTLLMDNPPEQGQYRVVNQFESTYSMNELARTVVDVSSLIGIHARSVQIDNPRVEAVEHYYNPDCKLLKKLGYMPSVKMSAQIISMLKTLKKYERRIIRKVIKPKIKWTN